MIADIEDGVAVINTAEYDDASRELGTAIARMSLLDPEVTDAYPELAEITEELESAHESFPNYEEPEGGELWQLVETAEQAAADGNYEAAYVALAMLFAARGGGGALPVMAVAR